MSVTNQNDNLINDVASATDSNLTVDVQPNHLTTDLALEVEDSSSVSSDTLHNSMQNSSTTGTQVFNHPFVPRTSALSQETVVYNNRPVISEADDIIALRELFGDQPNTRTPKEVASHTMKALTTYYSSLQSGNNKVRLPTKYSDKIGHHLFLETFERELSQACQEAPQFFKEWFPILLKPNPDDLWVGGLKPNKEFLIVDRVEIASTDFKDLITVCENIVIHLLRSTDFHEKFLYKRPELDSVDQHPTAKAFMRTLIGHSQNPRNTVHTSFPVLMAFVRSLKVEDYSGFASPHLETIWNITSHSFNPANTFGTNKKRTLADLKETGKLFDRIMNTQVLPHLTFKLAYFTEILLEEYSHIHPGNGDNEFANTVMIELNRMISEGPEATFNYDCLASWYNKYSQGPWLTKKSQLAVTSFSAARKRLLEHTFEQGNKKKKLSPTQSSQPQSQQPQSPTEYQFLPRGPVKFDKPPLVTSTLPWCRNCGFSHEMNQHIFKDGKLISDLPESDKLQLIEIDKTLALIHPNLRKKQSNNVSKGKKFFKSFGKANFKNSSPTTPASNNNK